ncbi:MAG: BlaI/MecI/CopY family transcriptional regulator [Thermoguttaceae bacterium]|jgi:predicted transcriptional regulator
MARRTSAHPTELELEILKILWREGPLPGRRVRDLLAQVRDLAYTSVMTIMKIMTQKGYVRRKRVEGNYVYSPCVTEEMVTRGMLCDLVERVFDGSATAVMLNLLETAELGEDELKQIRRLINRKRKP